MTTSSRLVPNFIFLNHFPHTQLLGLMRSFCYSAFLNKTSKQLRKSLSVSITDSSSYVKNMAYLGFITVPDYFQV